MMTRTMVTTATRRGRRALVAGDPKVAIAYMRLSPNRSRDAAAQDSLGREAQVAANERWAQVAGAAIVATREDLDTSGDDPAERDGFMEALELLRAHGAGVLVVANRQRLARSNIYGAVCDQLVKKQGAVVVSADGVGNGDGPDGDFFRAILDAFGAYERARIRSRTRAAFAAKRKRGLRLNPNVPVPWGHRLAADGVHLEEEPREREVAQIARELRGGGQTLRAIGAELERRGHVNRVGRRLDPRQVARIVALAHATP